MKEFVASVAKVFGLDTSDNLVFEGTTLIDSSITKAINSTDVRGGENNKLLYKYYHSGSLTGKITNAQFSLNQIALNSGVDIATGATMWTEETVTVTSGVGSVTYTPVASQVTNIYGWVAYGDVRDKVTFSTKSFTLADTSYSGDVCVRYFSTESAAKLVTVYADAVPSVIKLIMQVSLFSDSSSTNKIGEVNIIVPKASMTGAYDLSMTADGVMNTPMEFEALAYTTSAAGCGGRDVYAYISKNIYTANWYDDVIALAIDGGDFTLADSATKKLVVYAVPNDGTAPSIVGDNYADLTFAATGVSVVNTAGATKGTVTGATGGGTVTVTITDKSDVEVTVVVDDGT